MSARDAPLAAIRAMLNRMMGSATCAPTVIYLSPRDFRWLTNPPSRRRIRRAGHLRQYRMKGKRK